MANKWDAPEDYHLTEPPVETENLLVQEHVAQTRRPLSRIHLLSWAAQSVLFIASIITLHQAILLKGADPTNCVQKHSLFCRQHWKGKHSTSTALICKRTAPALAVIHDDYEVWRFNGTFRSDSPYKGPPSASVDAAWNRISDGA